MYKRITAVLLSAVLCLGLAACGGGTQSGADSSAPADSSSETPASETASVAPSEAASEAAPAGDGETLKLAIGTDRIPWIEPLLQQFTEQTGNPVEVIEIVSGSDMYTKITMMMQSAQTSPDVITEDGFMINSDAAAGYLEPLDDLVASEPDFQNFIPAVLAGGKAADGKQYGIPFSTDVQGIWYSKPMFEAAGITVPFAPKNWAEIIDAGKKLKEANAGVENFIPIFLFASKTYPEETSMRTFQNLFFGTGGELYDAGTGSWIVDKENMTLVFNFVNDVYNVEKLGPALSVLSQQKIGDLITSDYMKNGVMGMYFSGSWERGVWKTGAKYEWPEGQDTWDYAVIPTVDGRDPGFTTVSGGWTWAIPANANNKEGAKELLKYVCSKEVQLSYNLFSGDLAVREDVSSDPAYVAQEMVPVAQSAEMMQYTHFRPSVEGYASVTALYTEVIESIAMGSATPEQALATMESELIRLMGEDKVIVK